MSMVLNRIGGGGGSTASIFAYGDDLSSTDTCYATKDGKIYNGVWTSNTKLNPEWVVPDGYTQLEYIESTGTQCINTGVTRNTSKIEINTKFQCVTVPTDSTYYTIFGQGSSLSSSGTGWALGIYQGNWACIEPGADYNTISTGNTNINIINFILDESTITISGDISKTTTWSYYDTSQSFNSYNIIINSYNITDISNLSSIKWYKFAITKDNILVRNFVPTKRNSDSVIGMYDTVTKTFYTNSGTGSFTAGDEIQQYIPGFKIDKLKDYGTYTLTCSNGTDTKTEDVEVDMASEFDVEISYILYLYNLGEPYKSITGGWGSTYTTQYWSPEYTYVNCSTTSATFNTDNVNLYNDSTYTLVPMNTLNKIDLSKYSKLYIDWACSCIYGGKLILTNSLTGNYVSSGNDPVVVSSLYSWYATSSGASGPTWSRQIDTYDISTLSESSYIVLYTYRGSGQDVHSNTTVYSIYVE